MTNGNRTRIVTAALAIFCALNVIGQQPVVGDAVDNGLRFGKYEVGFRYDYSLDASRKWEPWPFKDGEKASSDRRPIRLAIWYPAEAGPAERMPFRNYIEPIAPDAYYAKLNDVMKVYDMWSNNGMFDKDGKTIDSLLKFQTTALSDAKPKKGKFPLIIYCSGWFSRSPDNSVMAEFLASHGFVVMTVPQLGTGSTVFDFKVSEERIWTQVNDLKFALDRARSFDNVDAERVAAVGFSIGGIVVLWLSQIDDRIDAIAGLDGSYVFKEWTELAKKGVTRPRKGFPILTMYRGHESLSSNIDLMFIEALDWADRSVIEVPKATHGEFSDEAFLYSRLGYPWKHSKYNTVSEATRAYYSVNHSVRAFFDAVLGGDQKTTVEDSLRKPVGAFGLKYRRLEARK